MAAYVIVEIETHDPELMARYRELAKPIVEAFGGRYLARGGRSEALEGGAAPERVVVLEFPSFERAREWWASEEYREAKELRRRAGMTRMVLVAGV